MGLVPELPSAPPLAPAMLGPPDSVATAATGPTEATVAADLVQHWLPQLDAVVDKLVRGASVADATGGSGLVTLAVADAFPRSQVVGFQIRGVAPRPAYLVPDERVQLVAEPLRGDGYDLVLSLFRVGGDLAAGRDVAAGAARVADAIARDGTWLIVEAATGPDAARSIERDLHELARAQGFHRWRLAFAEDGVVGYEVRR